MAEQDRASFGVFPQLRRNRTRQDPEAAKNVPVAAARGFVSGVGGAIGDLESLAYMPYDYFRAPSMSELVTGEKKTKTFFPTSEDIEKKLPFRGDSPVEKAVTSAGQLAGGFYYGRGSPLRVLAESPQILKKAGMDFAMAGSPSNVVKQGGGNWFDKNLKQSVSDLKKSVMTEAELADLKARHSPNVYDQYLQTHNTNSALNNWLEKTYQNYVKNEMATPEDRVRKMFDRRTEDVSKLEKKYDQDIEKLNKKLEKAQELPASAENNQRIAYIKRDIENKLEQKDIDVSTARQTIGHDKELANEYNYTGEGTRRLREKGGFPERGMATSEVGGGWENLADSLIGAKQASTIQKTDELTKRYPWLDKVDPESMIYKTQGSFNDYTSMDHVMDILRQDLRSGALSPDKLKNITVDQAIERAADFDRAAAKKMREAVIRNTEGFPTHKEYPEGYKWIELTNPKTVPKDYALPEGMKLDTIDHPRYGLLHTVSDSKGITQIEATDSPEKALLQFYNRKGGEGYKTLEDALKYEGDTMGHCVGRYCPDVAEGRTRIFSLRDRRGEPHVTVEMQPPMFNKVQTWAELSPKERVAMSWKMPTEGDKQLLLRYGDDMQIYTRPDGTIRLMPPKELLDPDTVIKSTTPSIRQIKGKGNARPIEKYDPYTQDFVKSGKFSEVRDLHNTGLYRPDPDELGILFPTDASLQNLRSSSRIEMLQRAKQAGLFPEGQNYLSRDEWENILRKQYLSEQSAEAARKTQMGTPPTEGNIKGFMDGLEPEMARGGPVHLSKGTKAAEIVEATAEGIAKLFNKYSGKAPKEAKEAMPLVLPRATPKTSQEINEIAERVARQMIGEHVTPQGKTVNLAGRSKKEAERVKQLQFELTPTGTVAQAKVNNPQIGDVNVAFPGDQTISDTILATLQGETINSLQQGGAKYGLGQRHLVDPEFWKSNIGPAQGIQGRIDDLYAKYMPERMVGEHLAMGPMSNNFAMHFADANLKALDWSKLIV
jgi:hypothetical protein